MSYNVLDLETTIRTELKRKANPFNGLNRIVAIGTRRSGEIKNKGQYFLTGVDENQQYFGGAEDGWLEEVVEGIDYLVGFNIKFDIHHAICAGPRNRMAWIKFIDRGGMIFDCQVAEYLIHGMDQSVQMASLDETAPKYGGNLKDDAVKSLWAAGVDTCDIGKDLLMDYLIGTGPDDLGDIGNTEKVFLGQLAILRARGGLRSALLNMGALSATIEMEYNGMFVDKAWALEHAKVLEAQLAEATAELNGFIPPDLPFEFKWTSRFHKSALIFGGSIKYEAKVPVLTEDGQQAYVQKDEIQYTLTNGSTTPLAPADNFDQLHMYETYKGGKNAGEYKTKKVKVNDLTKPKMRNEEFHYTFPGFTTPDPRWASKDAGVYSTAADVIEELAFRKLPFTTALARQADIAKDLGTYFITTDKKTGEQKGLLTLVGPDGIVHHKLNTTNTITARLSSSDPNLQNVSKGTYDDETGEMDGSQIKRAFISRYRGGKIIQSDFTSLEIYVQAILTMCRQLIDDLRKGLDMHVLRAEQAWGKEEGMDYAAILKAAKDEHHPDHKKWKKKRNNAKVFSFQRAYGAGVKKIAATTGMTESEVEALIAAEAERYPELGAYIERVTNAVKDSRTTTGIVVPHPDVKGLMCYLGRGTFTTPDGKVYSFRESPSPKFIAEKPASKGGTAQSFSPTEIKNYPMQGTGGEWAKAAMYLSMRAFYRMYITSPEYWLGRAVLVNQVHDAIYVDAHGDVANAAAAMLEASMLEASTYMEWWFKWNIPLPVPCETKMGNNMMEEHTPTGAGELNFNELVAGYACFVREDFINNYIPSWERSNHYVA